jgi:hypothetical protein
MLMQHYVIKFVSDLRQVGGFPQALVSTTNRIDRHDIIEISLTLALNAVNQTKSNLLCS